MPGDLKKRLVYLPLENRWRREWLTPEGNIQDYEELTVSGVGMRFDLEEIKRSMAGALADLENV